MKLVVVGVGNRLRGDDEAGILAAEAVRTLPISGLADVKVLQEPCDLVEALEGYDGAIIVDACLCSLPPGEVVSWSLNSDSSGFAGWTSAHSISVERALLLAEVLASLPQRIALYAVSGKNFQIGDAASESVKKGALDAAQVILQKVLEWQKA